MKIKAAIASAGSQVEVNENVDQEDVRDGWKDSLPLINSSHQELEDSSYCTGDVAMCSSSSITATPKKRKYSTDDDITTPKTMRKESANGSGTLTHISVLRLPSTCPLPTSVFTPEVLEAIKDQSKLKGLMKTRLLREASRFYWGICRRPTHDEYVAMSIALCDEYPPLKDKKPINGKYWVRRGIIMIDLISIPACYD